MATEAVSDCEHLVSATALPVLNRLLRHLEDSRRLLLASVGEHLARLYEPDEQIALLSSTH